MTDVLQRQRPADLRPTATPGSRASRAPRIPGLSGGGTTPPPHDTRHLW
jgi:hypothetical protein